MLDANPQKSSPILLVRLAIMMFLQFFIWGAWYVSMFGFLTEQGMTLTGKGGTSFSAAAYTVAPLAAIIAPLTLGLIVDRLMNTEWVLAILNLIGAGLLWFAPTFAESGAPESFLSQFTHPFVLCLFLYMLCFMPTLALTASLSFKHLSNGEKEFPIVRVLGTIGWIVGNWAMWGCRLFTGELAAENEAREAVKKVAEVGVEMSTDAASVSAQEALAQVLATQQFNDSSEHIFHVAAIASVLLGIYCLTLPRTRPPAAGQAVSFAKVLGIDAWSMLKDKAFFVFAVASFLICIPLAGYYAEGFGYVKHMGVSLFGSPAAAMSTGQMSEILFMLIMPFCFARLGVKNMLAIGMGAWVLRYAVWGFAFGQEGPLVTWPIFLGILLHGICYDFFFVTGMIYTDKKARPEIRGQAQSLVVMLTQGFGLGLGAQAFGLWKPQVTSNETVDYSLFWYAPAVFALVVLLFFLVTFWDRSADEIDA